MWFWSRSGLKPATELRKTDNGLREIIEKNVPAGTFPQKTI